VLPLLVEKIVLVAVNGACGSLFLHSEISPLYTEPV
jgi:hypothetical protein